MNAEELMNEVGSPLYDIVILGTKAVNPIVPLLSMPKTFHIYEKVPRVGKYLGTVLSDVPVIGLAAFDVVQSATTGKIEPRLALEGAYVLQRLGHFVTDYAAKPKKN